MVEARGVEPLSERMSEGLSTSVVFDLEFPVRRAQRPAQNSGSFI